MRLQILSLFSVCLVACGASVPTIVITDFDTCVSAGGIVQESYPALCIAPDGTRYVQSVASSTSSVSPVSFDVPVENSNVQGMLMVSGTAPGFWFFEANAPIVLKDMNGTELVRSHVTAVEDWMTEDTIHFTGQIEIPGSIHGPAILTLERVSMEDGAVKDSYSVQVTVL